MAKRESYEPGTFCAVDLATRDTDGAKRFYSGLFGWEAEEVPVDEGGTYTILRLDGDTVAGLFEDRETDRPAGWVSYVSVEDADATAKRASELGGGVITEAFDVMDVGRVAVLRDPTGGAVAVWQAGTHSGAARVNEPGCLTWNELATSDVPGALIFYNGLFGWTSEELEGAAGPPYTMLRVGQRGNGGVRPLSGEEEKAGVPPYWAPYFAVESLEPTIERAGELGGQKTFGPLQFPAGRIAGLRDAQGAPLALWEGELAD